MPVTFFGKWSLAVVGNVEEFEQRIRIVGSAGSDGIVAGTVGTQVAAIDGAAWQIYQERSSDKGVTWIENIIQRVPSVTPQNGLIVTLYGDDSVVLPQDSDFSVQFTYLNPVVNPPGPTTPPFNFTLPAGSFWPPRPTPKPRECCCCRERESACRCGHGLRPSRIATVSSIR